MHAQREIREYAKIILEITRKVAPLATASFERYTLQGVRFSGPEMEELRRRLRQTKVPGEDELETGPESSSVGALQPASESSHPILSSKELERF